MKIPALTSLQENLNQQISRKTDYTYFSGLARTLWPIVTKLVSWFDMNHAKDDTLQYNK